MRLFSIIILCCVMAACTSSTKLKPQDFQKNIADKYPVIGLQVSGGHHIDSGCFATGCYSLRDRMPEFVYREFRKSKNFSKIYRGSSEPDWVIAVDLWKSEAHLDGNGGAKLAATVLTLGVVPTTARHEYRATIQVYYKNDVVKSYEYVQIVDEVSSVLVDVQASDSDAAMLIISKFFSDIETESPFDN